MQENGTLYIKEFDTPLNRNAWNHIGDMPVYKDKKNPSEKNFVGEPLDMYPGDALIFSSHMWHRSSENQYQEVTKILKNNGPFFAE